ncbi:MAG: hypothetical protein DMD96_34055 [Candidatus Rokuibacteriota bacterium]|nr:MAG: hypothetical protein DMD96_34055 [Candidatus Rokubacteria bacterium]
MFDSDLRLPAALQSGASLPVSALERSPFLRPCNCHLGLGRLYRCTGKRLEAQEHLTTTAAMYREMGRLLAGAGGE